MSEAPQLKVSARAETALREAMERLFTGRPAHTDGKLTKNNLWREAGVSRATMNRATGVLADWDDRIGHSPASLHDQRQTQEMTDLRCQLKNNRQERQRLLDQVDAAATVIAVLLAENTALREQATKQLAVVIPSTAPTSFLSEDAWPYRPYALVCQPSANTSTREFGGLLRGHRAHCPKG